MFVSASITEESGVTVEIGEVFMGRRPQGGRSVTLGERSAGVGCHPQLNYIALLGFCKPFGLDGGGLFLRLASTAYLRGSFLPRPLFFSDPARDGSQRGAGKIVPRQKKYCAC